MSIPFQLKKVANYGSLHPAAARLFLQMGDLLGVSDLVEAACSYHGQIDAVDGEKESTKAIRGLSRNPLLSPDAKWTA